MKLINTLPTIMEVDFEILITLSAGAFPDKALPIDSHGGPTAANSLETNNDQQAHLVKGCGYANKSCTLCMKPNCDLQCSNCKSSFYCSERCMKIDQPCHSMVCAAFDKIPPRPSPNHSLGILFPSDNTGLQLVWYTCDGDYWTYMTNGRMDFFGFKDMYRFRGKAPLVNNSKAWANLEGAEQTFCLELIQVNSRLKRPLCNDRTLFFVSTCDIMGNTSRKENPAVTTATGPYGVADEIPRGPGLLIAGPPMSETELNTGSMDRLIEKGVDFEMMTDQRPGDVQPSDLRHVVDWFLYHNRAQHWTMLGDGVMWGAALICMGDDNLSKRRDRTLGCPMKLTRDHPIIDGEISPISEHIGIPIRLRPAPYTPPFEGLINAYAAILMVNIDIDDPDWGLIPDRWYNGEHGTVLAVREDRGYMNSFGFDLALWCFNDLRPLFENARKQGTRQARERAMRFVTLQNFEAFRQDLKDDWEDVENKADTSAECLTTEQQAAALALE
ncbi:hypothetical protein F5Y19DRAFT_432763 [Xylariaceae sp. FL1651]|nr:hypothetical protein F5Y19DRAFT_432763 [Xylariaceae sp. FL1651]